jgi:magnesium transporter
MLRTFPDPAGGVAPIWLDLLSPGPDEVKQAETIIGEPLPTREDLSAIESSSRVRRRGDVLLMSVPTAATPADGEAPGSPIGFILSRDGLATLRFTPLKGLDAVWGRLQTGEATIDGGLDAFAELCEEIIGRLADALELLAEELRPLSAASFHADDGLGDKAVRSNQVLRRQLRSVGRMGDRLSNIRDTLAGLDRVVAFASLQTEEWPQAAAVATRLESVKRDIASLSDYDAQLFNKVQFLLDATVGLIGIAQNDIFKVLTIVSIVGIPPTLIASMYGMNFKTMPEYDWPFGYAYGLTMIALSAIVPLIWFKGKGWF